jgi:hypothetical protein
MTQMIFKRASASRPSGETLMHDPRDHDLVPKAARIAVRR